MQDEYSEKLKKILAASGWSQEQLARQLEVSTRSVQLWLTGEVQPRPGVQAKISELETEFLGRNYISACELRELEEQALSTELSCEELLANPDLLSLLNLHTAYHSDAIEGSTLTLQEVATVLDNEQVVLPHKTLREHMEVRGHRAALEFLLQTLYEQGQQFTWSEELICQIHLRLMNGIFPGAGFYRQYRVRIVGSFVPLVNHLVIPREMAVLVEMLNHPQGNLVKHSAVTHARFEQIHPFGDGNGRTGRLIMLAQALRAGVCPPLVLTERKKAYYRFLQEAQTTGKMALLRSFLAESMIASDEILC